MPLKIIRNDITKIKADVIVNSANPKPVIGLGVDSKIHQAAGNQLLEERKQIGNIEVGSVEATQGYELSSRFIFHTVGPIWIDGNHQEIELLKQCYQNCLNKAYELKVNSIAFPLISTGTYGFPKDKALDIAIECFQDFLNEHEMEIILVVFDKKSYSLSKELMDDIQSFIDERYVEENYSPRLLKACRNCEIEEDLVFTRCESPIPFDKMMQEVESTFSERLMEIIIEKDLIEKDVYKRANISRKLFSKIRNNKNYQPSKITAIALAIGLQLDLEETKDFIGKAGYALTHSSKFDIIIEYFISNHNYDMFEINEVLFMFDQQIIGG